MNYLILDIKRQIINVNIKERYAIYILGSLYKCIYSLICIFYNIQQTPTFLVYALSIGEAFEFFCFIYFAAFNDLKGKATLNLKYLFFKFPKIVYILINIHEHKQCLLIILHVLIMSIVSSLH